MATYMSYYGGYPIPAYVEKNDGVIDVYFCFKDLTPITGVLETDLHLSDKEDAQYLHSGYLDNLMEESKVSGVNKGFFLRWAANEIKSLTCKFTVDVLTDESFDLDI